MIYLMAFTIHTLLILPQDERHRRVADIYIVSVAFGILVWVARIVTVLYPPLLTVEMVMLGALCACASVCGAGVAVTSGQSWRAKMRS
jgi:hypothetical protein